MLLFEITAFLRDSYRRLPRSTRVSLRSDAGKAGAATAGSVNVPPGSAPGASGECAAAAAAAAGSLALAGGAGGRRWSAALSSMGQSQASAQSLQSIPGDGHSFGTAE